MLMTRADDYGAGNLRLHPCRRLREAPRGGMGRAACGASGPLTAAKLRALFDCSSGILSVRPL
jgi:hypothetical protein